jgi:lysophospholipase L1-like esterase
MRISKNEAVTDAPITVSALGDSITAGTPFWDPAPHVRTQVGSDLDERHQWPYWAERTHPGIAIRNHGVNLERTDQIAMRLNEALVGAHVLIVQGGINDIVQDRPFDETIADLTVMIEGGQSAGAQVAIANVLPWNNGFPARASLIRELNTRIASLADSSGVLLLDFYATLEDPERPGRVREAWTTEGDHPSVEGHRRLGELAFRLP